jgi:hypothetical protein
MSINMDLDWLEYNGHTVDRIPVKLADGREYYHVDGLPRTVEQIAQWVLAGRDPVAPG